MQVWQGFVFVVGFSIASAMISYSVGYLRGMVKGAEQLEDLLDGKYPWREGVDNEDLLDGK